MKLPCVNNDGCKSHQRGKCNAGCNAFDDEVEKVIIEGRGDVDVYYGYIDEEGFERGLASVIACRHIGNNIPRDIDYDECTIHKPEDYLESHTDYVEKCMYHNQEFNYFMEEFLEEDESSNGGEEMIKYLAKYKSGKALYYFTAGRTYGGTIKLRHVLSNDTYNAETHKLFIRPVNDFLRNQDMLKTFRSHILDGLSLNPHFAEFFEEYKHIVNVTVVDSVADMEDTLEQVKEAMRHAEITKKEYILLEPNNVNVNEEKQMKLSNKFGLEFGKIDNGSLAITPFGLAVKSREGYVAYKEGELIDVGDMILEIEMDIFWAVPCPKDQLKEGDIIKLKGRYAVVLGDEKYLWIDSGEEVKVREIKNLFGLNFATKVITLIDFSKMDMFGNESNAFNPLMLMAMSSGKGDNNFMEMMLMSQMFNNGGGFFGQK